MTRRRGWSDITCTDQFCGAGGSSIGAEKSGVRVRMAMNHWALAVETHNTNFPKTDHDCCDISASDPRRYPSTDILITSPECTTHSPAGGNRRRSTSQSDLFHTAIADPTVERSRATMWDVPRFTEYHRYRRIIVENVVEVLRWELFDVWLKAMHTLGYRHTIVSLNSMFCWPTPQSRDRVYINFWRKGDKAPDLDFRMKAPCARCGVVDAVQTWKNGRTVGKYRTQYVYTCPSCRATVTPFYYCALNAIDFAVPAERIGDRSRPLKERTLERIRFGLEKYGNRPLMVRTNMTSGVETRVRGLDEPHMTQTASWLDAYVAPFLVRCANTGGDNRRVGGADEPFSAVHAGGGNHAVVGLHPFLVKMRGTESSHVEGSAFGMDETMLAMVANSLSAALVSPFVVECSYAQDLAARVRGCDEPLMPQTTQQSAALVTPFITMRRGANHAAGLDGVVPTVTAQGEAQHLLIQGAAQISLRDASAMRVAGLDAELMAQGCAPQQGIMSRTPFIVSQYRTNHGSGVDEPMPSMTTVERHELVQPGVVLAPEYGPIFWMGGWLTTGYAAIQEAGLAG